MCKAFKFAQIRQLLTSFFLSVNLMTLVGCQPATEAKGTSEKTQAPKSSAKNTTDADDQDSDSKTDDLKSDSGNMTKAGKKSQVKIPSAIDVSDDPGALPTETPSPPLSKSALVWDGVTAIGTTQLFLIPIE